MKRPAPSNPNTNIQAIKPVTYPAQMQRLQTNISNHLPPVSNNSNFKYQPNNNNAVAATANRHLTKPLNIVTPKQIPSMPKQHMNSIQPVNHVRVKNTVNNVNHYDYNNNNTNNMSMHRYTNNGNAYIPPLRPVPHEVMQQRQLFNQMEHQMIEYQELEKERDRLKERNMELDALLMCAKFECTREIEEKTGELRKQILELRKELNAKTRYNDKNDAFVNDEDAPGAAEEDNSSRGDLSEISANANEAISNKRRKMNDTHSGSFSQSQGQRDSLTSSSNCQRHDRADNIYLNKSSSLQSRRKRKSKLDQFIRQCSENVQSLLQLLQFPSGFGYPQSISKGLSVAPRVLISPSKQIGSALIPKISNTPVKKNSRAFLSSERAKQYDDYNAASDLSIESKLKSKSDIETLPTFLIQVITKNIVLNVRNEDDDKVETDLLVEVYSRICQLLEHDSFCTSISTCSLTILQIIIDILFSSKTELQSSTEFAEMLSFSLKICIMEFSEQCTAPRNERMMQALLQLMKSIYKIDIDQVTTKQSEKLFDSLKKFLQQGVEYINHQQDNDLSMLTAMELLSVVLLKQNMKEFDKIESHFPFIITDPLEHLSKEGKNHIVVSKMLEVISFIVMQYTTKGIEVLKRDQKIYPILHHILCTYQDEVILKRTTVVAEILQINDKKIGPGDDLSGLILVRNYLPQTNCNE